MAKSTTLKTKQGERLYPKTTASLTFMSNNVSVEAEINDLKSYEHNDKGFFTTEAELLNSYPNNIAEPSIRAGWHAVVGTTDTVWIWDVESNKWVNSDNATSAVFDVNGKVGNVVLTGQDINSTATVNDTSVTKPITGHLNDIYTELEEKVTLDTDQIITGTKVFDEVIGLRNVSEGTVDQIKHINSNFLITSGTGENLLNIDEGLETISAFNRQLAFEDEISQIQGDYVSYSQQTGKTENQKAQARANIGAGTSDLNEIKVNNVTQNITNGTVNITIPEPVQSIPVIEGSNVWDLEEGWYILKDSVIINGTTYNILSEGVSGAQLLSYIYTLETPSVDYDTKLIYFVNSSKPENGNIDVNTSDSSKGTLYRFTNGTFQEIWTVYPRRAEGSVVTNVYVENNVVKIAKDGDVTTLNTIATKQDITNAIPTNTVTTDTTQTVTGEKDFTGGLKKNGKSVATEEYVNTNGGKIDTISVNNVQQTITNKNVNIDVPTDVSEISTTAQMSAINSGIDSTKVGKIASNEAMITSLATQVVEDYVPKTRTVNNKALTNNITLTASDVNALPDDTQYVSSVNGNSGAITGIATTTSVTNVSNRVTSIEGKIPSQATSTNQLADKDFVNSSINNMTAFYITSNVDGDPFPTRVSLLNATTYYSGGEVRVPSKNDYAIVLSDENHSNATTRYIYYNQWEYQYTVNETPLTANQLSAINSGITSTLVSKITANETNIAELTQDLNDYVPTSRKINNKPLTNDITLTAGDVGALPNDTVIPTVNNGMLTIQKNGTDVGTFTANQSGNSTVNITVPTGTASNSDVTSSVTATDDLPTSNAIISYVTTKIGEIHTITELSDDIITIYTLEPGIYSLTSGLSKIYNLKYKSDAYISQYSFQYGGGVLIVTDAKFGHSGSAYEPVKGNDFVFIPGNEGFVYYGYAHQTQGESHKFYMNSNYITNTVNNLTNYYTKSETYTQSEVDALISAITGADPSASSFMVKNNPVGTGSFSLNRRANTTTGTNSVTLGHNGTASGSYSVSIGYQARATGNYSVALGYNCGASGNYSTAEGYDCDAYQTGDHAEGYQTTANAYGSHAEGGYTETYGWYSHAEGLSTHASHKSQHVGGEYNIIDTSTNSASERGTYVEIIGNGSNASNRSNARTLDWYGNEVLSGNVTATGFKTPNGTSSQVLTADGNVKSLPEVPNNIISSVAFSENESNSSYGLLVFKDYSVYNNSLLEMKQNTFTVNMGSVSSFTTNPFVSAKLYVDSSSFTFFFNNNVANENITLRFHYLSLDGETSGYEDYLLDEVNKIVEFGMLGFVGYLWLEIILTPATYSPTVTMTIWSRTGTGWTQEDYNGGIGNYGKIIHEKDLLFKPTTRSNYLSNYDTGRYVIDGLTMYLHPNNETIGYNLSGQCLITIRKDPLRGEYFSGTIETENGLIYCFYSDYAGTSSTDDDRFFILNSFINEGGNAMVSGDKMYSPRYKRELFTGQSDGMIINGKLTTSNSLTVDGTSQLNGDVTVTGYVNATSDIRLKENIDDINEDTIKSMVENTPIKAFNYKCNGNRTIGLMAQDIENIDINGATFTDKNEDGNLFVRESKLVYILWNYCQQLNGRIKELEKKVE